MEERVQRVVAWVLQFFSKSFLKMKNLKHMKKIYLAFAALFDSQ